MDFSNLPAAAKLAILGFLPKEVHREARALTKKELLPVPRFYARSEDQLFQPHWLKTGVSVEGVHIERPELLKLLSAEDMLTVSNVGYIIKDGFLGSDLADRCFEECERWLDSGKLEAARMLTSSATSDDNNAAVYAGESSSTSKNSSTTDVAQGDADDADGADSSNTQPGKWKDTSVRGDLMTWIHDRDLDALGVSSPNLHRLLAILRSIQGELNEACPSFQSSKSQTMLTCYPGKGTRYVRHLDAHVGGPTRKITLLYYVNKGYEAAHGGSVRIYTGGARAPSDRADDYVDVEPLANRLLVFQSRLLEHEVLPAHHKRFAITTWLY